MLAKRKTKKKTKKAIKNIWVDAHPKKEKRKKKKKSGDLNCLDLTFFFFFWLFGTLFGFAMIPVNKRPISPAPQEKRGDRKEGWSFSMSDTFSSVLGGQKQAQQENNRSERVDLRVDLKDLLRLTKTESISDEKTCKTLLSIWGQSLCSLPSFKVCVLFLFFSFSLSFSLLSFSFSLTLSFSLGCPQISQKDKDSSGWCVGVGLRLQRHAKMAGFFRLHLLSPLFFSSLFPSFYPSFPLLSPLPLFLFSLLANPTSSDLSGIQSLFPRSLRSFQTKNTCGFLPFLSSFPRFPPFLIPSFFLARL